ncbi:MAG: hypothetical protein HQL24_08905, partial [Candidatus Omnitrophica bacterium]|nr:hypothetical protein [Candidatus Omnitrophota bacterium]
MKSFTKIIAVVLVVLLALGEPFGMHYAFALPQGEEVMSGSATFDKSQADVMKITTSDQAIINYDSFNIAKPELVQFFQPGADSIVLNRVTGG